MIWLEQKYSTKDKMRTRSFEEESRPFGQHWPNTATLARLTLEHAWRDKSTTLVYFQQWHMAHKSCQTKNTPAAAHTKMERSMLNITYRDKQNIRVREKTKVTGVIEQVRRRKWTWVSHVSRIRKNRWTLRITNWKPYERKRPRGRPARRWREELDDYWNGTTWQR